MADDVERFELDGYIELWKKTVDVQQHFNDIQWRIRGLALTAVTFTLGAAAVAARDPSTIEVFGGQSLPRVIVFAGLVLWLMFGFVDGLWYHQFLKGSVRHGEDLEAELRKRLPAAGLTGAISAASQVKALPLLPLLNSTRRLWIFYGTIAALLLALAFGLGDTSEAKHESGVTRPPANAPARTPAPSITQSTR